MLKDLIYNKKKGVFKMNCIFCKIINKEIPSKIVYEDDLVIAILDLSQATYGHTLVMPKKHYANIYEIDDDTLAHLIKVVKKLAIKLKNKLHADGINILNNNDEAARQTVMHYHIHILPRYKNDDLNINFTDHSKDTNLDDVLNKINS